MPTYLYPPLPANTKRTIGLPVHDKAAGEQARGGVFLSEFQGTGWVLHLEVSDPDDFPGSPPNLLAYAQMSLPADDNAQAELMLSSAGRDLAAEHGFVFDEHCDKKPTAHHLRMLTAPQIEQSFLTDAFVRDVCATFLATDTVRADCLPGSEMHRYCTELILDAGVCGFKAEAIGLVLADMSDSYQDGVNDLLPLLLSEPASVTLKRVSPVVVSALERACRTVKADKASVPKGFTWMHFVQLTRNTCAQVRAAH